MDRPSLERFTTKRLVAERLRESHLGDLLRMDRDPRIMDPLGGVRSVEASHEYLRHNLDHWDRHGFGLWMLRLRTDDAFVGRAYVRGLHIAGNEEIAIGFALVPDFWGKGLATEIAKAIVDIAFSKLGLSELVAAVRPNNQASRRVLEKVGMRYETDATYKDASHMLYRVNIDDRRSSLGDQ